MTHQNQWSTYIGFIYAVTGAAVGLGNIWKFPYMTGMHGGSAFVMLYIIFVFFVGLPVMLSEMVIGRGGQSEPIEAFKNYHKTIGSRKGWVWLGWWGSAILLLILSFYSVVAGWSIGYMYDMFITDFYKYPVQSIREHWDNFIASPLKLIILDVIFLMLTMWVVRYGVQKGIERASKIMMPMLFILLLMLVVYALTFEGFDDAVRFLFAFKFQDITPTIILAALGHAFFSLAVGAGVMIVYASYLPKRYSLGSSVIIIALINLLVALLAGLAIFPLVFTYQLPLESGPGLMYQVLPVAFGLIPFGQIIGIMFFLLLLLAAWTSSISLAEPLVLLLHNKYGWSRLNACLIVGSAAFLLSIGSVFSFNVWKDVQVFKQWTYFAAITDLTTNIMLPIGALGYALFAGWVMHSNLTRKGLSFKREWSYYCWHVLTRFIAPLGIFVVIISAMF